MIIANPTIIMNGSNTNNNLNIHYGESEPENKNCLWIPRNEPLSLTIDNAITGKYTYDEEYSYLDKELIKPAICRYKNLVYIFGGCDVNYNLTDEIRVLNLDTMQSITLDTKLSTKKNGIGCACVNDKIYLLGGYKYLDDTTTKVVSDTIEIFDPVTNTISVSDSKLNYLFGDLSCCACEDIIYCFGGNRGYSTSTGDSPTNNIFLFNTRTGSISNSTKTLSSKNSNSVSVLRGEHIYIFGGYNNSRMVNKYYINDGNIETLTDLEYNVNGSYGYGFLGDDIYFIYQTNLHKYNIPYAINNLIFNLPVSKYESVATFDSNYKSLLILGGAKKDNISKFNVIQELLKDHIHIITTLNYNKVNLVENENTVVRVGIDKIFCGNSSNIGETISGYIYDTTTNTWVDIKNTKLINM